MRAIDTTCPKCQQRMVQGFITDYGYGTIQPANWVDGAPRKSFWTHTKVSEADKIPVGTFRCEACGYLQSYARPDFGRH